MVYDELVVFICHSQVMASYIQFADQKWSVLLNYDLSESIPKKKRIPCCISIEV